MNSEILCFDVVFECFDIISLTFPFPDDVAAADSNATVVRCENAFC